GEPVPTNVDASGMRVPTALAADARPLPMALLNGGWVPAVRHPVSGALSVAARHGDQWHPTMMVGGVRVLAVPRGDGLAPVVHRVTGRVVRVRNRGPMLVSSVLQ